MADKVVEFVPSDATVALGRLADLDENGASAAADKVGWKDLVDCEPVPGTLEGVAQIIRSGPQKVRPTPRVVEPGIELAVRNGELTGMLVGGTASASLKVSPEWAGDRLADD